MTRVSPKLRLGVIGAGSWAVASHLPNLAERRDEVEFVAVARQGRELLERIKADWGFSVASENYQDVIDAGIDICVVSSPTAHHYEHARAALEAGAHVLIEKPMTIDPEHAWELVELANANGLHLICAFGWHYRPLFMRAKAAVDECPIGTIEELSIRMQSFTRELLSNRGAYPKASPDSIPEHRTWTDPGVSGGGYAQAQLSHALAAALWLTSLRGQEVFAYTTAPLDAPVELHDAIVVRYEGGAIGTITGASSHSTIGVPENELDIRAVASEGQLALDVATGTFWIGREDDRVEIDLGPEGGLYDCVGPPNALVDLALEKTDVNPTPGELGARTVEVLAAVYQSATANSPARVKHPATDRTRPSHIGTPR
jgi:predicted dehydrogenase